ncbi:MAG: tetratricopeptide repeat protein [Alphaproteobacteria bacterium]|nr:tetratricopeptide repeat protein [Alphaproteobacteria bacterium]
MSFSLISLQKRLTSIPLPVLNLALVLAVLAAYANCFDNALVFDDALLIKMNAYLRDWSHLGDILTTSTTSGAQIEGGFFRPLQILLYWFIFQASGEHPFLYHLLNVALHAANTCLVFALGRKLAFKPTGAFIGALLWGLHPIHTEAVTYISGTADPLFVFFCLAGLIVLLPQATPFRVALTVPLFLLALVSKETAIIFPALATVCLLFSPQKQPLRVHLHLLPLWLIGILFAYWRIHTADFDGPQSYERFLAMEAFSSMRVYAESFLCRIYTFLATLPAYAELLFWPHDLHMERNFSLPTTFARIPVLTGFIMSLLAASVTIYSLKTKRWRGLGWGFAWFAVAYAPNTGLFVVVNSIFLEHWMYTPSIGLFLGAAQAISTLLERAPPKAVAASLVATLGVAGALGAKTYSQNMVWRSPETFYMQIIKNGEESARVYNNLALYYTDRNDHEKAIRYFLHSIRIGDVYAETHYNLALAYLRQSTDKENVAKAIDHLERAQKIQPNFFRADVQLSIIYKTLLHDPVKAAFHTARARKAFSRLRQQQ